jgi:hypothetical protein
LGRNREERGEGEKQPAGGGEKWAEPETGRERGNSFPFTKFIFCSNLLKRISKTNLNLKKLHSIKYMQQHGCTYMCLGLIVNFNSIKN